MNRTRLTNALLKTARLRLALGFGLSAALGTAVAAPGANPAAASAGGHSYLGLVFQTLPQGCYEEGTGSLSVDNDWGYSVQRCQGDLRYWLLSRVARPKLSWKVVEELLLPEIPPGYRLFDYTRCSMPGGDAVFGIGRLQRRVGPKGYRETDRMKFAWRIRTQAGRLEPVNPPTKVICTSFEDAVLDLDTEGK